MEKTDTGKTTEPNSMDCGIDEFLTTGRTGRRNAMPDILDSKQAAVSTGGLPFDMEKLSCSDNSKEASSSTVATGNSQSSQPS